MLVVKIFFIGFVIICLLCLANSGYRASLQGVLKSEGWWTARRDSADIAPSAQANPDLTIIQVYAAPTYGWKGMVAVHPWIIFKRAGETQYSRYEVISWGSGSKVQRNSNLPDAYWYGAMPRLLVEHRGKNAEQLIPQIEAAIKTYPWPETYHAWPGPNSNTFIAHIGRSVPSLNLIMPANALGKDYRPLLNPFGLPPSGSGVQFSLLGVAGLIISKQEGIEINLLGLSVGVQFLPWQLRLPFIGGLAEHNAPGKAA